MGLIWIAAVVSSAAVSADPADAHAHPAVEAATETSAPAAAVRTFPPGFFADHDPENAWDLIAHVPGFSPDVGGGGGRGLAGSAGNILLDGRRPPAKTTSIQTLLRELPLARVDRVELVGAGARALDFAGHAQVLNIVSKPAARPHGELQLGVRQTGSDSRTDTLNARASHRIAAHSVRGAASRSRGLSETPGRVLPATPTRPFERETAGSARETASDGFDLSADLALRGEARLALSAALSDNATTSRALPPSQPDLDLVLSASDSVTTRESLGAELSWPDLLGADWRFSAIQSRQTSINESRRLSAGRETGLASQRAQGETAGRLSAFFTLAEAWRADLALSAAHNFLQGASQRIDDGARSPIDGSDVRVDEQRASADAGLNWTPASRWGAEAGLRVDWSHLRREEAAPSLDQAAPAQTLIDVAPRAGASFTPWDDGEVRLRVERRIGQLAFSQFLASASLDEDRVTAGAARLEPERSWIGEAVLEQRWADVGLARLTAEKRLIENPIRTVPTPDGAQVQANVDEAMSQSLAATVTAPLEVFDLPGATLSASVTARRSEIADPITGERRALSGQSPVQWRVGWRQVLGEGDVIWGASISDAAQSQSYGLSSFSQADADPAWTAFLEWDVTSELETRLAVTGPRSRQSASTLYSSLRGRADPLRIQDSASDTEASIAVNAQWRPRRWFSVEADYNSGAASATTATSRLLADGVVTTSERLADAIPVAALRLRLTY